METINLYRMRRLGRTLDKMMLKIRIEESRACRTTSFPSGMPGGTGNHSKVEEGAIRLAELKDAYKEAFDELERMRTALEPFIDSLDDYNDRAVMRLRYLKGYGTEKISDTIFMTERMVYYILSRSEKQLARRFPKQVAEGK